MDANEDSDAYPHAIGFDLLCGPDTGSLRKLSVNADGEKREELINTPETRARGVCRGIDLEPSSEANMSSVLRSAATSAST